jgi:cell fate regulator YaaT (PSP1 superfamily)
MPNVINVRFRSKGKAYFFDPADTLPRVGDEVVVETAKGIELGTCVRTIHTVDEAALISPLRPVLRIATPEDIALAESNRKKEKEAFDLCQKKIEEHKLEMKLVDVEYSFDGSKILFFFTSEGRVDFRELVKDLAGIYRTRIELRQIGVRDSARLVGGLGICGRPFCCSTFLDDFQPVSIKMAKSQSLSLNPVKISGTCGRLMCCLKYEQDSYEHLLKTMPKVDAEVDTPKGKGKVTAVNLLRRTVNVKLDDDTFGETLLYRARELGYTVNGEYKAPEPPDEDELPLVKDAVPFTNYTTRTTPSGKTLANIMAKRSADAEKAKEADTADAEEAPEAAKNDKSAGKNRDKGQHHRGQRHHRSGEKKSQQASPAAEAPQQHKGGSQQQKSRRNPQQHKAPVPAQGAEAAQQGEHQARKATHRRGPHKPAAPMDEKAKARADAIAAAVAQAKPKSGKPHHFRGGRHKDGGENKGE